MENKVDMSLEEFRQRERAASLMADELATLRVENERLKTESRDAAFGLNDYFGNEITELTRQRDEYKQDALRWRLYASSPQTALALGTKLDPITEQDWKAECDRLADAAINGADGS